MKKNHVILMIAAVSLLCGSVQVQASSIKPALEMETEGASSGISEKWSDYQIQIDGEVYQFPMMYSDFTAYGWSTEDADGIELEPNQYDMLYFSKDDVTCRAYVINLAKNNEAAADCIIGGIKIDKFDWDTENGEVVLPGGIKKGESDLDSIKEAYGTPSDKYEGDLYTKLKYETDSYCYVEMSVYNESGVLEDIDLRNFVEPEGFDAGEISEEVPEAVASYEKPDGLADSLGEYQISLDGEAYTLPVPVSTLIADGWELDESQSDGEIVAGYFGWVTLRKGGQEIREIAVNPESYGTIPENCWIEELAVGGFDLEAEGGLPGGIHTGMTEEELLEVLDGAGVSYEVDDESDSFKYYTYNVKEYDQYCEVTVYTDEDGLFEPSTVIEVECSNAFQ